MLLFATTVFLSAFLLFQIQPIVAKMILPWFGGSSSVWSVCIVFFQTALLAGYAYVHVLHKNLQPHRQALLHGVLLLISLALLPVAANPAWKAAAVDTPTLAVIGVLAGAVGVPYVLLSTTGPLMQAWYARTVGAGLGAQPYRLYALSNLASMLALLSYPVLVEPAMAVGHQALLWSAGYALFALTCGATALFVWRHLAGHRTPAADVAVHSGAAAEPSPRVPWRECALWIALAATPSLLLLALTRHLTQDVAPIPFLWVLPLALYLLSFILVFDAPRYYVRGLFMGALPLALGAVDLVLDGGIDIELQVVLLCTALFVFCMLCHGELVRRKPPVAQLTLFYLMMSVGGALGGLFVGLVAPVVFTAYFELPLGLWLCAALVVGVTWRELRPLWRGVLLVLLLAYGARLGITSVDYVRGYLSVERNFYGQLRVAEQSDDDLGPMRVMRHGRIAHGEQALNEPYRRQPTAYYCERSGIGRAIRALPTDRPHHIGVLGTGVGTLVAYGRAQDRYRLYEINEQVIALAERDFTYLKDTPAAFTHVLGDGRLMMEAESPQAFDVLAMDAFSGDSVPAHLLTIEAMRSYIRHLRPDGMLALHITNKYLNMRPVVAAAAAELGWVARLFEVPAGLGDPLCRRSTWVVLMRPEQAASMASALATHSELLAATPGFRLWTDSYYNLLGILKN
jgi:hypothetical protein